MLCGYMFEGLVKTTNQSRAWIQVCNWLAEALVDEWDLIKQ
jgi:hypothetical protein